MITVPMYSASSRTKVVTGATAGALLWGVHGVLEYAIFTLLGRVMAAPTVLNPTFWETNGILLAAYLFAGAIFGAAGALALLAAGRRDEDAELLYVPPALALTLAYFVHFVHEGTGRNALLVFVAIAAVQLLLLVRPAAFLWLGFVARPWPLSLLLLSRPLAVQLAPDHLRVVRAAIVLVVIVCAIAWQRFRPIPRRFAPLVPAAVSLCVLTAVILTTTIVAMETLPSVPAVNRRSAQGKPNVILIVMDTVRADRLSTYGYNRPTTPNLDRFAREAVLYRNVSAVSNMTLPTHASLFTGLYPDWHGAHYAPPEAKFGRPLPEDRNTMAEILAAAGYTTMAVAANSAYVNPNFGLAQGFDVFDVRATVPAVDSKEWDHPLARGMRNVLSLFMETAEFDRVTRTAAEISRDASRLVEAQSHSTGKQPFFLFLNFMDTHAPYLPPPELRDRFPGRNPRFTLSDYHNLRIEVLSGQRSSTARERAHLMSQYDASLMSLDTEIGRFLDELRSSGVFENSVIAITSDHGEAFGEKGRIEHAVGLYADQIRVPLMIRYPHGPNGTVVETPVNQVDVLPTLLSAVALPVPDGLHGRDLRRDAGVPRPVLFAVSYQSYVSDFAPAWRKTERAAISGNLKLITSTGGTHQLFDVRSDAGEDHDIYTSKNEEARRLEAALNDHLRSIPVQKQLSRKSPGLSKGNLDQLKSLGYVQ